VYRLDVLVDKVQQVQRRIECLAADSPYRPAFETIVRDGYVHGDQAAWCAAR
jgi:hypothetical protein